MVASMSNPLNMWAAISLMIFFLESLLRIFAYRSAIFHRKIDLFDTVVVWIVCSTFLALVIGNKGDKQQNTMLRYAVVIPSAACFFSSLDSLCHHLSFYLMLSLCLCLCTCLLRRVVFFYSVPVGR